MQELSEGQKDLLIIPLAMEGRWVEGVPETARLQATSTAYSAGSYAMQSFSLIK